MSEKPGAVSVNLNVRMPREQQGSDKEPYTTGFGYGLWCTGLVGVCGIHRFYLGKYGTGLLWLCTFGLLGVGQFIDLFRMKTLVGKANSREGRLRAALPRGANPLSVRQQLLKAAMENGGEITVSQGVLTTDKSFDEVEKVLDTMVSKGYVDVDNAPGTGVIVYRFPELMKRLP